MLWEAEIWISIRREKCNWKFHRLWFRYVSKPLILVKYFQISELQWFGIFPFDHSLSCKNASNKIAVASTVSRSLGELRQCDVVPSALRFDPLTMLQPNCRTVLIVESSAKRIRNPALRTKTASCKISYVANTRPYPKTKTLVTATNVEKLLKYSTGCGGCISLGGVAHLLRV